MAIKCRVDFIKDYWEKEKIGITKNLLTNKKNLKKAKPLVAKLNSISDSIRDTVIKNYLSYCYYQYSIKYLTWR